MVFSSVDAEKEGWGKEGWFDRIFIHGSFNGENMLNDRLIIIGG